MIFDMSTTHYKVDSSYYLELANQDKRIFIHKVTGEKKVCVCPPGEVYFKDCSIHGWY